MVDSCQRFPHQPILALKFLSGYVHRGTLPQSRIRSTAPSEREPGTPSSGRMPFNVPLGNRNVAGDFHRPYERRLPFNVPLRNFHRQKIFRFPPQKRYRVGQGTHVWEPAQSVTEKTGWGRAPTVWEPAQSVTKKIHRGCGLWRKILWRTGEFTAGRKRL